MNVRQGGEGILSHNNCVPIHSTTKTDRVVQGSANYAGRSIQPLPVFVNEVLLELSHLCLHIIHGYFDASTVRLSHWTEIVGPTSLKYLLSSSLQKKLTPD